MPTYILTMGAESKKNAAKKIKKIKISALAQSFEEKKFPKDWREDAEEDAECLIKDIENKLLNAYKDKIDKIRQEYIQLRRDDKDFAKQWKDNDDDFNEWIGSHFIASEVAEEITNDINEIRDRAIEYADGRFIYNSNDKIMEALECIDYLDEYKETDSGLWEGLETPQEIINAQATYTLSNAITHFAEEKAKDYLIEKFESIKEKLNNKEAV